MKRSSPFLKKQLKQIALARGPSQFKIIKSSYTLKRIKFTNPVEDDYLVIGKLEAEWYKGNTKVVLILKWEDGMYKEVFRWLGWNKGFNAEVNIVDLNESDGVTELAIEHDRTGGQSYELVVEIYKYLGDKGARIWSATLEESQGGCSYKEYENRYRLLNRGTEFKEIDLEIHYKESSQTPPYELVKELRHVNSYYWNGTKYVPKDREFSYRYEKNALGECIDLP